MGIPGRTDDHQWSQRHLSHYVEGDLRPRARRRLDRHARGCVDCARRRRSSTGSGPAGPVASPRRRARDDAAGRDGVMPPEGRPAPDPVEHAPELADTEAGLLARAQAGDVGAFERLSGAYADRVFMLLLRLLGDRSEAEDVAQEVMLRAWQGITRFRGQSSYFTWL